MLVLKPTHTRSQTKNIQLTIPQIAVVAGGLWTVLVWYPISYLAGMGWFDNPILASPLGFFIVSALLPSVVLFIAAEVCQKSPWRNKLLAASVGVLVGGILASLCMFWGTSHFIGYI